MVRVPVINIVKLVRPKRIGLLTEFSRSINQRLDKLCGDFSIPAWNDVKLGTKGLHRQKFFLCKRIRTNKVSMIPFVSAHHGKRAACTSPCVLDNSSARF